MVRLHFTLRFCASSTPVSFALFFYEYILSADYTQQPLDYTLDIMIASSLSRASRRLSAPPLKDIPRFFSNFTSSPGVIDGRAVAKAIKEDLRKEIEELKEHSITPGLSVILVGNRTDSATYVSMKQKACAVCGIDSKVYKYKGDESEEEILQKGTVPHLCIGTDSTSPFTPYTQCMSSTRTAPYTASWYSCPCQTM